MPQITCPNCGKTITLENRRKIDFDLIINAVKKEPRSFTDLLTITRLSRKTLSLRLKELCESNVIIKRDGKYHPNSSQELVRNTRAPSRLSRMLHNGKMRTTILLASLILTSAMSGYGLAIFVGQAQSSTTDRKPVILGNSTMALDISNVTGLYGWQACIAFNATQLTVLDTKAGGFLPSYVTAQNLLLTNVGGNGTDIKEGRLLISGCILGPSPGVNGSGRLALITFGRYTEAYDEPEIIPGFSAFETMLVNSNASKIPPGNWSLTLSMIEDH